MSKCISERDKAEAYRNRTSYWEKEMAKQINLSMPESLEFFEVQLQEAEEYHKGLKDGSIKREHSFSLTYSIRVKDLKVNTQKYYGHEKTNVYKPVWTKEESRKIAFNVVIFSLVAAIALVGVVELRGNINIKR